MEWPSRPSHFPLRAARTSRAFRNRLGIDTVVARASADLLRLLVAVGPIVSRADVIHIRRTNRGVDGGSVAKVLVDPDELGPRHGDDVGDRHLPLDVSASATGAIELSEVVDLESINDNLTSGVVLQ